MSACCDVSGPLSAFYPVLAGCGSSASSADDASGSADGELTAA